MNKIFAGLAVASLIGGGSAFACDMDQQQDASTDATPMMSQVSPAVVSPAAVKGKAKTTTKTALKSNAKPDSVAMPLKTVSAQ